MELAIISSQNNNLAIQQEAQLALMPPRVEENQSVLKVMALWFSKLTIIGNLSATILERDTIPSTGEIVDNMAESMRNTINFENIIAKLNAAIVRVVRVVLQVKEAAILCLNKPFKIFITR